MASEATLQLRALEQQLAARIGGRVIARGKSQARSELLGKARKVRCERSALARLITVMPGGHQRLVDGLQRVLEPEKRDRVIANAAYAAFRAGTITKRQARRLGCVGAMFMKRPGKQS